MDDSASRPRAPRGLFRVLGPAVIVASVVLGPGSILTASKVGADYGYSMIWVLVGASLLMIGTVALSARLGVAMNRTLCGELADRLGRPAAAFIGIVIFVIIALFQTSNNVAVLAAAEQFTDPPAQAAAAEPEDAGTPATGTIAPEAEAEAEAEAGEAAEPARRDLAWPVIVLVGLNALVIAAMFGLRRLYQPIEKLMVLLVGLMIVAFLVNLIFAGPSILGILGGLVPRLPAADPGAAARPDADPALAGSLLAIQGMLGTTFSVAGAFYQAYLVREKGWTMANLRQGLIDSVAGIALLGIVSIMVIATAAAVLHGRVGSEQLGTLADVARQLEPAFGRWAMGLFSAGIFAGAVSSFLVNALIGGALLSDGLGFGGKMDQTSTKLFTTAALLIGLAAALLTLAYPSVNVIIFAQAMTVVGLPLLVVALLYLATRPDLTGNRRIPMWMKAVAVIALLVTLSFAGRTVWNLSTAFAG